MKWLTIILALNVIFLFIGAGFSSAISTNSGNETTSFEECGCNENTKSRFLCNILNNLFNQSLNMYNIFLNIPGTLAYIIGIAFYKIAMMYVQIMNRLYCNIYFP